MRYERVKDIVRLAVRLQAVHGGLTLDDIRGDFGVSRRTAERLRDAVEAAFGPLEIVDTHDTKRHWRLRSDALRRLVSFSAEELAELASAATALSRSGLEERATVLRDLAMKLRAAQRTASLERIESDLEALVHAEGLATRPGPRERLDSGLLAVLREAIPTARVVEFQYLAQATGQRRRHRVCPHGLLYGNRAFLVAPTDRPHRYTAVAACKHERMRSSPPRLSSGTRHSTCSAMPSARSAPSRKTSYGWSFASTPTWRATPRPFFFIRNRSVEENADGSLTVRFEAGGIEEMCRHLFTWGESVTILKPARLRRRLTRWCAALAQHHEDAAR